jgi:uncharacterized membrane protein
MTDNSEYNKVINVPYTIIIASFIIIIITTNMTDVNGLSALLGGYSGLMIGMLFVIILNLVYTKTNWIDMLPSIIILTIVLLLIIYLSIYFDKIAKGEVSSYYSSFSILSTIFLFAQVIIIFLAIFNNNNNKQDGRLFTNTTFSILGLLGLINLLIVITIGIILKFYSTQG